jgi:hypothetical protein
VVQMAKGKHDRREYAVKFFLTRKAFDAEHALYWGSSGAQASVVARFLPKVCAFGTTVARTLLVPS